jgi:hypothetical protein
MRKKIYLTLLIIFFIDVAYSFYQHYHMPLLGDMADIIIPTPTKGYYKVLHDPFGMSVLLKNEVYPNPNRFFAHWTTSSYFLYVPLILQKFVNPIDSIYLSCAVSKIIIQLLIIYLLAVFISNTKNIFKLELLIAVILVAPLFQTSGYNRAMGIIDQSVIYAFFYSLPLGLLLLFFLPFFDVYYYHKKQNIHLIIKIILVIFIVFLSFNGPLVLGIVLIVCPLVLINFWFRNYKQIGQMNLFNRFYLSVKNMPNFLKFYFTGIITLSLYSLYLDQNNSMNLGDSIPLIDRYMRLPIGIYNLFTRKLGLPLLIFMISINVIIINKYYKSVEGLKILNLLKWIGVFSLLYILLLPLGGFRAYRENIIRYDTFIPITIALIFIFGITSYYLINIISKKFNKIYVVSIIVFLLVYTNADQLDTTDYACERHALETISKSSEKIVVLDNDCTIMEWIKINDIKESDRNAVLFNYWNITKEKKLYYIKE